VVQQNAGASEEMSSTAEELSSQAEHLQSAVEFFKVQAADDGSAREKNPQKISPEMLKKRDLHSCQMTGHCRKRLFAVSGALGLRKSGVALDMGNGDRDADDDEFEKF